MKYRWINEYVPAGYLLWHLLLYLIAIILVEYILLTFIVIGIKTFPTEWFINWHYLQFQCHFSGMGLTTCIFKKNQNSRNLHLFILWQKAHDVLQYCNKMASCIISIC
jgi:hypothetical protein